MQPRTSLRFPSRTTTLFYLLWLKGGGPAQDRAWEESRAFSSYRSRAGVGWRLFALSLLTLIPLLKPLVFTAGLCGEKVGQPEPVIRTETVTEMLHPGNVPRGAPM